MENVVIDYKSIIEAINVEIEAVRSVLLNSSDEAVRTEIAKIKKIIVSDEQSFLKKKQPVRELGYLHIVVKFSSGSINYASSACPVVLTCMGTANEIKPTQLLLSVFASSWTTKNMLQDTDNEMPTILQVWNTPEVLSNFNEINIEYRSLFTLRGVILVGPAAIRVGKLTYYYGDGANDFETVNIMSFQQGYRASLDSQPFGNTQGFVKSEVNFSTYTFTVSTYMLSGYFGAAMQSIMGFRNRTASGIGALYNVTNNVVTQNTNYFVVHKNDKLKIKIEFTNGYTNFPNFKEGNLSLTEVANSSDDVLASDFFEYFKVVDIQTTQDIGDISRLVVCFTR